MDEDTEPREELSPAEKAEMKKKQEEQHAVESNAKTAKVVAKGAATAYLGAAGGKAVDVVAKTKAGQAVFNQAGKNISNVTKHTGVAGKAMQGVINKANDTGITDAADSVAGGLDKDGLTKEGLTDAAKKTGEKWAEDKVKGNNPSGGEATISEGETPEDGEKKKKSFLKKIIIRSIIFSIIGSGFIFVVLFVTILGPVLGGLLSLTEDIYNPTGHGDDDPTGPGQLTTPEVERTMVYVGDHRIGEMSKAVSSNGTTFLYSDSGDYTWLAGEARSTIADKINDPNVKVRFVIINLGLYDLNNYDRYYNIYSQLASTYSDVHFIYMGLGPIKDGESKVTDATNQKIQTFNSQMKSKIGDNFIDIYGMINQAEIVNGDSYTNTTYSKIHNMVLDFIKENFTVGVPFLLDSYPHGTNGTNLLTTNIVTALGDDAYDSLNVSVANNVAAAGKCTKSAVAAAGVTLAYGLYQAGYRLPYYWGGGHEGSIYMGVNNKFGNQMGGSCSSSQCYYYYGFDCSGFVSWALGNAMGKDIGGYVTTGFMSIGQRISFQEAGPGDILVNEGHVILVVENKGSYLQTLESCPSGLIFTQYTQGSASGYQIMSLQNYISGHC